MAKTKPGVEGSASLHEPSEVRSYETIATAFRVIDISQAIQLCVDPSWSLDEVLSELGVELDEDPAQSCGLCLVRDSERIYGFLDYFDDSRPELEGTAHELAHPITRRCWSLRSCQYSTSFRSSGHVTSTSCCRATT